MICPRCATQQQDAAECAHCGILVAKYLARAARPAEAVAEAAPPANSPAPRAAAAPVTAMAPAERRPPQSPLWLTADHKRLMFINLDRLLRAGVPLPESLELAGQAINQRSAKVLRALATSLHQQGDLLAELRRHPGLFDPVETALVATALQAGALPAMCARLAVRQQNAAALHARLRAGLVYPAFLIGSSAILTPLPLAFSQGVGAFFGAAALNVALLVGGALGARWVWQRVQRGQLAWLAAAVAEAIPGLRRAVYARRWALWFEVVGLTAQAGVPLTEGLRLAGAATGEPVGVRNSAAIAVKLNQATLSDALIGCAGVPERAPGALRAAERSGHLADTCTELGQESHEAYARYLALMVAALRTAAMAAVALWVAWSVIQQMMGLVGDPLSAVPGAEGAELRRELERAVPSLRMSP